MWITIIFHEGFIWQTNLVFVNKYSVQFSGEMQRQVFNTTQYAAHPKAFTFNAPLVDFKQICQTLFAKLLLLSWLRGEGESTTACLSLTNSLYFYTLFYTH